MDFNPARLTLARRRRGLTKRDLAQALGCSERSVRDWESGESTPLPDNINHLSATLRFPVSFFGRPEVDQLPSEAVSFRALSRTKARFREQALAGGELALELNDWLEATFQLPKPEVPDLREMRENPEAAAVSLRAAWGLGDKPITSMIGLLEFKGVRVFSLADDCYDLDAYSFWRGTTPFVFLNTLKSVERSRFDAAHELGHLVMHRHGPPAGREAEREADAFAAAFLMPRSSIVAYAPRVATLPRLIQAKRFWKVSVAALAHRLHEVSMISDWQYRSLCIQIQKAGWRTAEPEGIPREMSQVFEKVFSSLRSHSGGKRAVASQLGWPLQELNALVFGLVLGALRGGSSHQSEPDGNRRSLQLVR